jgi:methylated-DNA-protein-cysteine methyltransferase-like protein
VKEEKDNPNFFDLVYQVVKLIPKGRVTSYGAIAKYLGAARSARMVGWAMNGSHAHDETLPAHRVVNRNGLLSGKHHFANGETMQDRLGKEGVRVVNDQIQDFKKVFWDPGEDLSL